MAALTSVIRASRRVLRVPLLRDIAPSESYISAIRRRAVATAASPSSTDAAAATAASPSSTHAAAATAPSPSTDPAATVSSTDAAARTRPGVMDDGAALVRPKVRDHASLVEARMGSLISSPPTTNGPSPLHGYSAARDSYLLPTYCAGELPPLDSADGSCLPHLDDYVPAAALPLGTLGIKPILIPFATGCTTMGFQTRPKVTVYRPSSPSSYSHGRLHYSSFSSGIPVITQILYSNPEEIALTPENYAKAYPLVYEVVPGGLIRADDISDPCTSKYMQTKSGTSLADQIVSLIVVNLKEGINIGPLLREDNVRIYPSNRCLQIISTEMEEQTGKVRKVEAYAAGAALYTQLLDYSVRGGLITSDLPEHVTEFIRYMENAVTYDMRILTNHSATFTPQVRMSFRLQAELFISDVLPSISGVKLDNVLLKVPYLDKTCVTCIQDKHPAFASWLAQAKKFTLATWTLNECGRTVVKVHRHGTVHSFGPYLKGLVSTKCTPISTDFLLNYKMPLYPSAVIKACVEEHVFEHLDMRRIRPEKASYYNFTC